MVQAGHRDLQEISEGDRCSDIDNLRTAEAAALRYQLTERMKDSATAVIVLGDLNDSQHSNTVNILTEQPRYLVGDSLSGGDVALYTAQTLHEYRDTWDVYYTYVHHAMRELLDYILVSQEFYDNSRERVWLFAGLISTTITSTWRTRSQWC